MMSFAKSVNFQGLRHNLRLTFGHRRQFASPFRNSNANLGWAMPLPYPAAPPLKECESFCNDCGNQQIM
jgi:hypothetical protein